ncbi:hypothetical protein [Neobacillus soli]|uniref:hypothetical protein n=1 Tax=Neobacillus soli TaxID=220688 RepID=UPI0008262AE6|nr:hypothetical protein [Neobacillus soli]
MKSGQTFLLENCDLSQRQYELLTYLCIRNIKAFPLRELVELDEQAQLKDERLFNVMKYTIFLPGKHIDPPNAAGGRNPGFNIMSYSENLINSNNRNESGRNGYFEK